MFTLLLSTILLFASSVQASELPPTHYSIDEAKGRCLSHFSESKELFMDTFSWGYTLLEMEDKFEEIYASEKRIGGHSLYKPAEDTFYLFYGGKQPIKITETFIESVTRQIEIAIAKGYADFVFFPDMGHSHLYLDQNHWDSAYAAVSDDQPKLYELMLADPELKPLYHLTEQLQMMGEDDKLIEDETLIFKYWNRNFMGKNDGSDFNQIHVLPESDGYNTVREIPGYKRWSAGFAVSASSKGCFPYRDKDGQTRYFDISLDDPRHDPAKVEYGGF